MAVKDIEFVFDTDNSALVRKVNQANGYLEKLEATQKDLNAQMARGEITSTEYKNELLKISAAASKVEKDLSKAGIKAKGFGAAFDSGFGKSGKGSAAGNANQAIIELGRGLSDFNAVGGFDDFSRGALASGNNLERFTEVIGDVIRKSGGLKAGVKAIAASFLGAGGLIFAVTTLIAFGPKLIEMFKRWRSGITEAEQELDKLRKTMNETNQTAEQKLLGGLNKAIDEVFEKKQQTIKDFNQLLQQGFSASGSKVQGLLQDIADLDEKLAALNEERKFIENYIKLLREEKMLQQEIDDILTDQLSTRQTISSVLGQDRNVDNLFAPGMNENPNEWDIVDADDVEVIDEMADSLEDLNAILRDTGSAFAEMSVAQATAFAKANEDFEKSRVTIESASDSLISAFESAATRGGNFIESLASGILGSIGSMLIKEGSAYIALGIARNAAFPGSGSKVLASGGALVAAGVGLKAGAAAIGRGGSSGSRGSAAPGSRAVVGTADTTRSNVTFEIGNNKLIGSLQQGLDKRGTFHGSSTLFPNN